MNTYKALRKRVDRGRDPRGKGCPVENNTRLYLNDDDSIAVRLHQTDIVTTWPDGTVELNTGGWYTMVTKDRITGWAPVRITSDKGVWYAEHDAAVKRATKRVRIEMGLPTEGSLYELEFDDYRGFYRRVAALSRVPYFDGIRFGPGGKCLNGVSPAAWNKYLTDRATMQKRIQAYCTGFNQWLAAAPREFPNNGDCWYCSMRTEHGSALGDSQGSHEHLLDHMDEKYYMGSLGFNALKAKGYQDVGCAIHLGYNHEAGTIGGPDRYRVSDGSMGGSMVRRAIRDYMYDRLLPAPPTHRDDTENRPLRNNKGVCAF